MPESHRQLETKPKFEDKLIFGFAISIIMFCTRSGNWLEYKIRREYNDDDIDDDDDDDNGGDVKWIGSWRWHWILFKTHRKSWFFANIRFYVDMPKHFRVVKISKSKSDVGSRWKREWEKERDSGWERDWICRMSSTKPILLSWLMPNNVEINTCILHMHPHYMHSGKRLSQPGHSMRSVWSNSTTPSIPKTNLTQQKLTTLFDNILPSVKEMKRKETIPPVSCKNTNEQALNPHLYSQSPYLIFVFSMSLQHQACCRQTCTVHTHIPGREREREIQFSMCICPFVLPTYTCIDIL